MDTRLATRMIAAGLLCAATGTAHAATTLVPPGDGTLQAAVTAAASGDVLELVDGMYTGGVTPGLKELTIRARSSADSPVYAGVMMSCPSGGNRLVVQGLQFVDSRLDCSGGSIVLLENRLTRTAITTSTAFACYAIGNVFDPQGKSINCTTTLFRTIDEGVFAGNTFVSAPASLVLGGSGQYWIMGNRFLVRNHAGDNITISSSSAGRGTMTGNRFDLRLDPGSRTAGVYVPVIVRLPGNEITVRNNIFVLEDASAVQTGTDGFRVSGIIAIDSYSAASHIYNNVFDYRGADFGVAAATNFGAVHSRVPIAISGNVFMRMDQPAVTSATNVVNATEHNLCSAIVGDCPGGGATTADPLMVDPDNGDFHLAAGSPGIDTGSDSPFLKDLDGSRNDVGAHGGPFDIAQFDAQRVPGTAPFVYPLMDANRSVDGSGNLQIRLIGVARHQ